MTLPRTTLQTRAALITVGAGGEGNVVHARGTLNEPDIETRLMHLFETVHDGATRQGLTEVVVDIRDVDYAGTGLWKAMVRWLRLMNDAKAPYRLVVVGDRERNWQEIGMSMLRAFGVNKLVVSWGSGRPPSPSN
jgi:hypothetical protein